MSAFRHPESRAFAAGADLRRGVSVIEDEFEMRLYIQEILDSSDDLKCFDTFPSAELALSAILARVPELALVDIGLPGMSGLECVRRLRVALPQLPIVIVTGLREPGTIEEASRAGCDAYLEKPFSIHQFLATLRFALSQRSANAPADDGREPGVDAAPATRFGFTAREQQVISCLCRGLLYKEIASELGVSFSLVHKVQNRVFRKLNARNRTEAVNKWQSISRARRGSSAARD